MHYLQDVMEHYPNIQKRYMFYPKESLPSSIIPVSFSVENVKKMFEQGEIDAKKTILDGQEGHQEWANVVQIMRDNVQ